MASVDAVRRFLVEVSRRHSRLAHEAEDIAHDILLAALRRGLPLDGDVFIRSCSSAARRHSAFLARSAARRRAREVSTAIERFANDGAGARDDGVERRSAVLSSPLQTTLLLLILGHTKPELRSLLGVTDAALRKRLQALRQRGPLARPGLPLASRGMGAPELRGAQVRLLPRLAGRLAAEERAPRVFGARDADGHGLFFAVALTNGASTATPHASMPVARGRKKGNHAQRPNQEPRHRLRRR